MYLNTQASYLRNSQGTWDYTPTFNGHIGIRGSSIVGMYKPTRHLGGHPIVATKQLFFFSSCDLLTYGV